jgi:hypothetical protein
MDFKAHYAREPFAAYELGRSVNEIRLAFADTFGATPEEVRKALQRRRAQ